MTLISAPAAGAIAVVTPRYGPEVIGGAEDVLADLARGLQRRGYTVEILTTCAHDHYTWANAYRSGSGIEDGIMVRRFPVEIDPNNPDRRRIGEQILAGRRLALQDQQRWMNGSFRSSGLWNHVFDHGAAYRAIIAGPYQAWSTFAVAQIFPRKSILMPCLHDEPQARLEIIGAMMEGAGGIAFLTEPERDLARSLYRLHDRQVVMGASVHLPDRYDPDGFRRAFGIDNGFFYYAGRREWGKGWDDLVQAYGAYLQQRGGRGSLDLVTSGVGEVTAPLGAEGRVIDVGLLSDEQRDNAMAAATAYVQPSAMESFSRSVLEAMGAGTPVIANGAGDVVSWHLERSGAGLTYRGVAELVQCLHFVSDEPGAAAALAVDGRSYVTANYRLGPVISRLESAIETWLPQGVLV